MRNELPETCFATLPGEGKLIILKRGETGYYPSEWETGDEAKNKVIADSHNRRRGITPAQVEAMLVGSMFDFDVPGANPQIYYDEARCVQTSALSRRAFFKDPDISYYTAIEGNLYQYQVAGKEVLYLDVSSLPESVMNMGRNYIILPDMVAGKPLVPVIIPYHDPKSGEWNIELEKGSYSQGKEVNAGFEIIAKVRFGPVEYVLGECGGKFPGFTTWERNPAHDGDGPPNYYWGCFFENREQAVRNLCQRAEDKFRQLHPAHKPSIKEQLAAKPIPGDKPIAKAKNHEER